jgi:hypothetical protein
MLVLLTQARKLPEPLLIAVAGILGILLRQLS